MYYELTTKTGMKMDFLLEQCAEVYREAYGGVIKIIKTVEELNYDKDQTETTEPSTTSTGS